jgi:threonine synthase
MAELYCDSCNREYPPSSPIWRCECGSTLSLNFSASFPLEKIERRPPGLWRYREAIPLERDENIVSFGEGFTPLVEAPFKGAKVYLKQEHLFPSGSYKDRGATVLISKVKELGIKKVVEDSSGNAGSAIAAYSAKAGIECEVYVPDDTPPGKLAQIRSYGARLLAIPGSREETAKAAMAAAKTTYYASHSWNPFFFQGTKTFAFEVAHQLGWGAPDAVVVPAGHGTLLLGAYMGFSELASAGVVSKIPKLIGVQAEACPPIHRAFKRGLDTVPETTPQTTLADGIRIANPTRGREILKALRQSDGDVVTVSEDEIVRTLRHLCGMGFYIEPTSAAAVAGLVKCLKDGLVRGKVVVPLTGSGLKVGEKVSHVLG